MHKSLVMKIFKLSKKSKNNISKIIVVGYNMSKVNGGYMEKLGSMGTLNTEVNNSISSDMMCSMNLRSLGFWLNSGASLSSKVSWIVGLLSSRDL